MGLFWDRYSIHRKLEQNHASSNPLDCEQSLFFFRFSESNHARVRRSRARHLRVSRFARRTTEKRETARSLPIPQNSTMGEEGGECVLLGRSFKRILSVDLGLL